MSELMSGDAPSFELEGDPRWTFSARRPVMDAHARGEQPLLELFQAPATGGP